MGNVSRANPNWEMVELIWFPIFRLQLVEAVLFLIIYHELQTVKINIPLASFLSVT